ncbi:hypothetical protein M4V62_02470 [Streptomyces durmitorensis]|uniref:Uncharacterized protein n=1 Tax=Streptomyces durmitorensis TaxID=319947 RepID=A0ABY4PLK5_9ACTN|nr:hypothetical protein [Streptomyces durmitorensis]UQT54029.1 hypothetical protein M4V62_02470 [Streptomyces durmitorensis]
MGPLSRQVAHQGRYLKKAVLLCGTHFSALWPMLDGKLTAQAMDVAPRGESEP